MIRHSISLQLVITVTLCRLKTTKMEVYYASNSEKIMNLTIPVPVLHSSLKCCKLQVDQDFHSTALYPTQKIMSQKISVFLKYRYMTHSVTSFNPYPTAFPYGNGMVIHFYQQQESSTTKTVHKVINKGLKTYV